MPSAAASISVNPPTPSAASGPPTDVPQCYSAATPSLPPPPLLCISLHSYLPLRSIRSVKIPRGRAGRLLGIRTI
jgi:hypothetical protein